MTHTKQQGFTLIELIVVMVILGILAATALPKFADLGADARSAVLKGAQGALASASAMAHGKYLVSSTPPVSVTYEGVTIVFSTAFASGYPKADSSTVLAAGLSSSIAGTTEDFRLIPNNSALTATSPSTVGAGAEIALVPMSVAGTAAALTCYVKYAEPLSATAAPVISVVSSGC